MYWGHAVSQDLIHWVHLPVCMEPQQEILNYPELVGGAFSGTALVDEEQKLRLFLRATSEREEIGQLSGSIR